MTDQKLREIRDRVDSGMAKIGDAHALLREVDRLREVKPVAVTKLPPATKVVVPKPKAKKTKPPKKPK